MVKKISELSVEELKKKSVGELYAETKLDSETLQEIVHIGDKEFEKYVEENFKLEETEEEKLKGDMQELYRNLIDIQKYYIDTSEDNYKIVALWIIGTWLHKEFSTFPYLFFQAMKGSGKTRYLKLIKELSWEGDMLASLSEAVLFRSKGTLCIDEFENIGSKDKNSLRELLNTAYKEGGKVKRMRKVKSKDGENQIVEEFNTFRPICIANITGMEEVLGDRCISIVLEKSSNKNITRKIENFKSNQLYTKIMDLIRDCVGLCRCIDLKNTHQEWNDYLDTLHTTLHYTTTLPTYNYTTMHLELFKKIDETGIDGRNLELTFPLIFIADKVGILDEFIEIIKKVVSEKKENEFMEGRDVIVYSLVAKQEPNTWYRVKDLESNFRLDISYDANEDKWLNAVWFGIALKRLNLITYKKRVGVGIEVMLNIDKAREKLQIFK